MGAAPRTRDPRRDASRRLAATIWLYMIIPKGFLPIQDTGLITAVTEAGPEVSFAEMQRLQQQVVDACAPIPTSPASSRWSASPR